MNSEVTSFSSLFDIKLNTILVEEWAIHLNKPVAMEEA